MLVERLQKGTLNYAAFCRELLISFLNYVHSFFTFSIFPKSFSSIQNIHPGTALFVTKL